MIDSAQKNITDLSSQVTSLHGVLANKQARGAFGQARMEAIVEDALPKGCFAFQHTLTNGKRPDCAVFLPDGRPLVIDAKFPLEAVTALREAKTDDERKHAAARAAPGRRPARRRHRREVSDPRRDAGHRADVRAVGIGLCRVARRLRRRGAEGLPRRVVLVSPSLLMLAIQVIQQIQKDARMREAADRIHAEVGHLMDDLGRLRERVVKLAAAFRPGQRGHPADSDLGGEDRQARDPHRGGRVRRRGRRRRRSGGHPGAHARKLQAGES